MPFDLPTFKNKLNDALNTIDSAPPEIKQRAASVRAALVAILEDIEDNPGEFVGGTS